MKKVILLGILVAGFGLSSMTSYAGGEKKVDEKKSCTKSCSSDKKGAMETSTGAKKSCCSKPKS